MKLSKTSTHAALAMAFLAQQAPDEPTQARQVAEYLDLPLDSALKVLQSLAKQGLIRSTLGRRGGYSFHRPAEAISLLDVIEAIDGPMDAGVAMVDVSDQLSATLSRLAEACQAAATRTRIELSRTSVAHLRDADTVLALAG